MEGFEASDLSHWSGGEWFGERPRSAITGFAYDSRILKKGDLFVALKTDQRDGHDFLGDAESKGAAAALVQEKNEECSLPQLVVDDTLRAFQAIACGFRKTWDIKVIGITGSCGKTTTKDLLCQLLGDFPEAQGTRGNLNNLIGVPTTILEISPKHCRFAIIEAGISEPGEMEVLAKTIAPDWAVFTAIGPAHLEQLGSVEGVAREKGFLAGRSRTKRAYLGESCRPYQNFLSAKKTFIVSDEQSESADWRYRIESEGAGMQIVFFERNETYFVGGTGRGLASNAALAIAIARDLEISPELVQERIGEWEPSGMRGEWKTVGENRVYLDCYNANPLSMRDSLDTFQALSEGSRNRLYLIGSMEELGDESAFWHKQLGEYLPLRPQDRAYLMGEGSTSILEGIRNSNTRVDQVEIIADIDSLQAVLGQFDGDLFIKGSRRYRLEAAMDYIPKVPIDERASC